MENKAEKYASTLSSLGFLCCCAKKPSLLDPEESSYFLQPSDMPDTLARSTYEIMLVMYAQGIEYFNIADFYRVVEKKPTYEARFADQRAKGFLQDIFDDTGKNDGALDNLESYYNDLKKASLMQQYSRAGINVNWIYDPDDILDSDEATSRKQAYDAMSPSELVEAVESRVLEIGPKIVDNFQDTGIQAGTGAKELLKKLRETPISGPALFDPVFSRVVMGARPGAFYLRSAGSGVGKTRTSMADACTLACKKIWSEDENNWVENPYPQSTLFISVELDYEELQTQAMAFISKISEEKIIGVANQTFEEQSRLEEAAQVLADATLIFIYLPNYTIKDVKNCIKHNIRVNKTQFIFLDYIASSLGIITEVSNASGGMKLREDQILHMLSTELKQIAIDYNVFVMSSTQTNADAKDNDVLDQNVIAGAKSIANRVDVGCVMMDCSPKDLETITPIAESIGCPVPNLKMSIYKNRRGKYTRLTLWMRAKKGICEYRTLFATDYQLKPIKASLILSGGELDK